MEKIIRIQRNEMNHTGIKPSVKGYIVLIVLLCISFRISAQADYRNAGFSSRRDNFAPAYAYSLDIHFDPVISWFSTNRYLMRNEGAMPGSSIGISRSKNYSPNYSFTSGVSITDAGENSSAWKKNISGSGIPGTKQSRLKQANELFTGLNISPFRLA